MNPAAKIYVAGHKGLVGSALVRSLAARGYRNLLLRTHSELDLTDYLSVQQFFAEERPDYVFLAAAKVGGILANNNFPAEFILDNLRIATAVIHAAYCSGVKRLLFLGSSCVYPKHAAQPIKEECLLDGPLEPTNRPYALAKIAGIEMCWAYNRQYGTRFLAAMPTNLYGPNDRYDLDTSHVIPALIRKFHEAKNTDADRVVVWGTGNPRREFLYSDDAAEACIFLMSIAEEKFAKLALGNDMPPTVNIGWGEDVSIRELASLVAKIVGFENDIAFDPSKPDGTPRKLLDVSVLTALGWRPRVKLHDGLRQTYEHFRQSVGERFMAEVVPQQG